MFVDRASEANLSMGAPSQRTHLLPICVCVYVGMCVQAFLAATSDEDAIKYLNVMSVSHAAIVLAAPGDGS